MDRQTDIQTEETEQRDKNFLYHKFEIVKSFFLFVNYLYKY